MDPLQKVLAATGYPGNIGQLNFIDSPLMTWLSQNISINNCVTEEELKEFETLQETGEVLFGDELDIAFRKCCNAGGNLPVEEVLEDIKRDELEHANHQLVLKKQIASSLRSSLSLLDKQLSNLQQDLKKAESEKLTVLEKLTAANNEYNNKLKDIRATLDTFLVDMNDLVIVQEFSSEEDTNLSTISNSTMQSSVATDKTDSKYLCQMPIDKYTKRNTKFCKLLKTLLLERMTKLKPDENLHQTQVMLHTMYKRLCLQKETLIKLKVELESINYARLKIAETREEIELNLWKPTSSNLRTRIADLENSSILNDSEVSLCEDDEDLHESLKNVCTKWAELTMLKPINDMLSEKIEAEQTILTKLEELTKIVSMQSTLDSYLCEVLQQEQDRLVTIMQLFTQIQDRLTPQLEATRQRIDVMNKNIQDYNTHSNISSCELAVSMSSSLDCDISEVAECYKRLTDSSHEHHNELVDAFQDELKTLSSICRNLEEFYHEEEDKKIKKEETLIKQNQWVCLRDDLELIASHIEDAKGVCFDLLENKENNKPRFASTGQ